MAERFAIAHPPVDESIEHFAQRVAEAGSLEALSRPLLDLLQRISGLDSVYLTEIDWAQQRQWIRFAQNRGASQITEGFNLPWRDTLCRRALEEGVRVETDVPRRWPDSAAARELGIKTYVSTPVRLHEQEILGTLCGISATSQEVPDHVLDLMDMFAQLLAHQIERERVVRAERDRARAAERSAALFAAISDVGHICSRARTLEPALRECAARLRMLAPEAEIDVVIPGSDAAASRLAMWNWARRCCHQNQTIDGAGWWRRGRADWAACGAEVFIADDCLSVGLASALYEGEFRGGLILRLSEILLDDQVMQQAVQSVTLHLSLLALREQLDHDLQQAYQTLEQQSLSDPLTGLPNRRCFERDAERLDATVRRRGGWACVAFIDLDGFKALNDRHGHDTGDRFLLEFGRRLGTATRTEETCARYGGDEFVLLAHLAAPADAEPMRARLAARLAGQYHLNGIQIEYPGPSIGIAVQHDHDESVADLLARADAAMYAEKRARRTPTPLHDP